MEKLLTISDLTAKLGIKKSTIYQWTHIEYIPHLKLGRFVRFKESEIEKWLKQKERPGRITRTISV